MKTARQIQSEIKLIRGDHTSSSGLEDSEANKIARQLKKLTQALYYIESKPNEVFLKSQLAELTRRKENILNEANFKLWRSQRPNLDGKLDKEIFPVYKNELGYKEITLQIKSLQYLLS